MKWPLLLLSIGAITTCSDAPPIAPTTADSAALPQFNRPFDDQIGGPYEPRADVVTLVRDRKSDPAPGLYNICYLNGFQTQPDDTEFWLGLDRRHGKNLILRDKSGNIIADPDYQNEMLLDISTKKKRARIASIFVRWIEQCRTDGFAAVDIDNFDSYERSHGLLTISHAVAFHRQLSDLAHSAGLAVAQKNGLAALKLGYDTGADFAIVESCNVTSDTTDECKTYINSFEKRLFMIQYLDAPDAKSPEEARENYDDACSSYGETHSIIFRTRALNDDGVFEEC